MNTKTTGRRIRTLFAFVLLLVLFLGSQAYGQEQNQSNNSPHTVHVYLFYGEGCPHCAAERPFLHYLQTKYPTLVLHEYEVWHNQNNMLLFKRMAEAYGIRASGVPTTFIGDYAPIVGYASNQTTGVVIEQRVRECIERGCPDPITLLAGETPGAGGSGATTPPVNNEMGGENSSPGGYNSSQEIEAQLREAGVSSSWILGLASALSSEGHGATARELAFFALIIGFIDGFNPCAFFVLFALLGVMLTASGGSKKRALVVGLVFVFFSGFMYFLFMAAWLNIFLVLGTKEYIQLGAGIVALALAIINVKDFFAFKKGVSLTIPEEKLPDLFRKIRHLTTSESLLYMAFATAVIAASVNLYELLCTAGLPMVFTRILSLHKVSMLEYYLYLVVYNVAYVVPLLAIVLSVVFFVSTMRMSERLGRVLKLTSGLMMLYLGLLLVLKPELLTNVLAAVSGVVGAILVSIVFSFVWFKLMEKREDQEGSSLQGEEGGTHGDEKSEQETKPRKKNTNKKKTTKRTTTKRRGR